MFLNLLYYSISTSNLEKINKIWDIVRRKFGCNETRNLDELHDH